MSSTKWHIGIFVFVGIAASLTYRPARGQDQPATGFHFSLDGQFRYGNISGFVQIPRAGEQGLQAMSDRSLMSWGSVRQPLESRR
jgi:hypothetical protein